MNAELASPVAEGAAPEARASFAAWFALVILSVTLLYAMIDRQVLILLAQPLKADLGLSDTQIGSLQGFGAVLFASIAVYPLGWIADRVDRRLVLALCILVWSAAIAACGLASNYWMLLVFVAFLGAGEAGLSPIVFAMIPELFPERQRMTANFIFYSATILAAGAGIAIAGAVIDHIGLVAGLVPEGLFTRETWRLVFFTVAVPGPLLAVAVLLIRLKRRVPVPRPDIAAAPAQPQAKLLDYLGPNWKGVAGVFLPWGMAILGSFAVSTWIPIILMRDHGLSPGQVGAGYGSAVAIGSVAGLALAGIAAKLLKPRWGALTPVRLAQLGYFFLALTVPVYLVARTPGEIFLIATAQMAMGIGGNSLMPTVVQDLAPADVRGRLFALSTIMASLFGIVSPLAVGLLSDHVFTEAGGLMKASITIAFPAVLAGALILRLGERQIVATVERVRAQ